MKTPSATQTLLVIALALGVSPALGHPFLADRVAELTRQIATAPDDPQLYIRRGDHFRREGYGWLALADYVKSRQLDTTTPVVDFSIGELLLATGHPARALPYLDRFLQSEPGHPGALLSRARALAGTDRVGSAMDAYEAALARLQHPRPDHVLEVARFLASHGQSAAAIARLDQGRRELGWSTALDKLALDIELEARSLDAALERLDRLSRVSARPELWLTTRAELLEELGRFEEARRSFIDARSTLLQRSTNKQRLPPLEEIADRIDAGLDRLGQRASLDHPPRR